MHHDHFDVHPRRRGDQYDRAGRGHHDPSMHPGWGGHDGSRGGFGPFTRERGPRRRSRGDVRSAILSLLADDGPSNGYALMKAIAEKSGGAWRASPGSVYPTLQQLVDEELIVARGEGRRTDFELTDAGRDYVEERRSEIDAAWNAVPRPSEASTELFEAAGSLMGVLGQFRHSATDDQRRAATAKITDLRKALYLILAD